MIYKGWVGNSFKIHKCKFIDWVAKALDIGISGKKNGELMKSFLTDK